MDSVVDAELDGPYTFGDAWIVPDDGVEGRRRLLDIERIDGFVAGYITIYYCGSQYSDDFNNISLQLLAQARGFAGLSHADIKLRWLMDDVIEAATAGCAPVHPPNPLCVPPEQGGSEPFQCSGDVLVDCFSRDSNNPEHVFDCASVGGRCGNADFGQSCVFDRCTGGENYQGCQDASIMVCGAYKEPYNCYGMSQGFGGVGVTGYGHAALFFPDFVFSAIAETCRVRNDGVGMCSGSGPRCPDGAAARCEGDELVSCPGGFESRWRCDDVVEGMVCVGPEPGVVFELPSRCAWPDADCNMRSPAFCEGTVGNFCVLGRNWQFDCASLGAECQQQDFPNGASLAWCAAPGVIKPR